MASITPTQLHKLIQIGQLVDGICGPSGELVRCSCLDHDDDAPHEPDCAWAIVSPAMELLWVLVGSTPGGMVACREWFADIVDRGFLSLRGRVTPRAMNHASAGAIGDAFGGLATYAISWRGLGGGWNIFGEED